MLRTITTACHTAHLDDMTGEGTLTRPLPHHDLHGLHGADWSAMLSELHRQGWDPSEDKDGDLCQVGWTADGREVIGLYGHDPITSTPTLEEQAEAHVELRTGWIGR